MRTISSVVLLLAGLAALGLPGCSSIQFKVPASHFDPPETRGELFRGHVDPLILQGGANITMVPDYTVMPPAVNNASIGRSDLDYAFGAGVGVARNIDFEIKMTNHSPSLFGLKAQLLGDPELEAKAGNTSLAVMASGGYGSDSGSATQTFTSTTSSFSLSMSSYDLSVIGGRRVRDDILVYGGPFFTQIFAAATITQPIASTTQYQASGVATQAGFGANIKFDAQWFSAIVNMAFAYTRFSNKSYASVYPGLLLSARF